MAAAISDLRGQADGSLNLLQGAAIEYSEDGTVALISIPTEGSGNDDVSTAALNEVRDEIVPATVGAVEGATVNVTGSAAQSKDFRDLVSDRLPLVFGFVFLLAFLLMLFTFRSIVIPIKAILLNLLSVGAAYGVLVLVFQEGWGESLLGFTSNGGVTSWLPLFLFVILFGLSMDYHVFILSRVREAYDAGMSTTEAVRHGISTTAGTVTSAAVVMVVVFSVFVTLSFIDFKQMGVGLAAAVLIDATIIRGVLLPATMKVLGDWNWYLPSWLEWLPHVALRGRRARRCPSRARSRPRTSRRRRGAGARGRARVGSSTKPYERTSHEHAYCPGRAGSRPVQPPSDNGAPAARRRAFSTRELAFMIGVPAAWGILLLFHPIGGDTFYENIEGNVTPWLAVHIGMGIFVPLFAGGRLSAPPRPGGHGGDGQQDGARGLRRLLRDVGGPARRRNRHPHQRGRSASHRGSRRWESTWSSPTGRAGSSWPSRRSEASGWPSG